ncbi:MAG TPA: hypothetical protein VHE53_03745 [Patescibacteria group bacterium]|nr:hypothetical protein [Patescibacteria group bacterium]
MEESQKLIHTFDNSSKSSKPVSSMNENIAGKAKPPIVLFVVLLLLGVFTGYVVAQIKGSSTVKIAGPGGKVTTTTLTKGQIFGSKDEKTFKDSAEGTLKTGGIDGEGAYHLERPGGDSQNVYLTSSVIDLSTFVGKKVKVWGQTNASDKAGWLMDVGRLQVE